MFLNEFVKTGFVVFLNKARAAGKGYRPLLFLKCEISVAEPLHFT